MATIDDAGSRYSRVAIGLHWLIGLAVIANICLAMLTEGLPRDVHRAAMGTHKALGMAILALTLVRILWRLVNKVPPLPETMRRAGGGGPAAPGVPPRPPGRSAGPPGPSPR